MAWAAMLVAVALAQGPAAGDEAWLHLRDGSNELLARRSAPVAFTRVDELLQEIERPAFNRAAALRLTRVAPPEAVDYFIGVTPQGLLLVGRRIDRLDYASGRYVFDRGELTRSYPPLDREGPWTWLVEVPVSRETRVMLEIRANGRWPVEAVTITPVRLP